MNYNRGKKIKKNKSEFPALGFMYDAPTKGLSAVILGELSMVMPTEDAEEKYRELCKKFNVEPNI